MKEKYNMILKKHITLVLLLFKMLVATYSQQVVNNSTKGYYVSNSIIVNGIYIVNENLNLRAVRIIIPEQVNHKAAVLYPYDIDEYGLENGLKFISSTIIYHGEEKKVFLKEVQKVNDSTSVYCYPNSNKDIYYIKKKGNFGMIVSDKGTEIWELFKNLSKCSNIQEKDIRPLKLNESTINKLYFAYTDCNTNFFQKFQYGITTGVGIGKPKTIDSYTDYNLGVPTFVGFFMQVPLDEYLVFQPELLLVRIQNKKGFTGSNEQISWNEELYTRYSLQIPLLFRYNFNKSIKNIIPYVEFGTLIDKNLYSSFLKSNFQYGFSVGTGFRYKFSAVHSFYFGLRFNHLTGKVIEYSHSNFINSPNLLFSDKIKLNLNALTFVASYNL